jgi:hypothetical protein
MPYPAMVYDISVNYDGNMFSVIRDNNVEVYQDTEESGQFELVTSFPGKGSIKYQTALSDSSLSYALDFKIFTRKYTKAENSGYGLKEKFIFTSLVEFLNKKREINSISMSQHAIFASSTYEESLVFYQRSSSSYYHNSYYSNENIFISDVDVESGIHRMVAGSYNNSAEVF